MKAGFDVAMGGNPDESEEWNKLWGQKEYDLVVAGYTNKLSTLLSQTRQEAIEEAEERVKQRVVEMIKLEMHGAEELQENIKIYNGDETTDCKLCGCDPVHQREYLIEKVSSL